MRVLVHITIGFLLSLMACFSFAQDPVSIPAPVSAALAANTPAAVKDSGNAQSLTVIQTVIENLFGKSNSGESLIKRFTGSGLTIAGSLTSTVALPLAGALALASMLWHIMLAMANRKSPTDAAIEGILFAVLTAFLISQYASIVRDVVKFGDMVITATGGTVGESVTNFMTGFLVKFIDVIVKGFSAFSITSWLTGSADMLFGVALMVLACFFAFTAMIELVGVLLMGPVVVGLAIAIGPIFIACLASTFTRRWFNQWFNFLVGGAFLTAVTVIVLKLLTEVVTAGVGAIGEGSVSGQALAMAMIAVGTAKIFAAIPNFADSILPGRTGAGQAVTSGDGLGNSAVAVMGKAADPAKAALATAKAAANPGNALAQTSAAISNARTGGAVNNIRSGVATAASAVRKALP
ncbi:type IV secretion system protein [Polaromonas naphthalenivorans]|uniref:TrbL/VirB6 plasmid conjugal transfer protein n=1 Tax=Polaromonas naphthalenivorans (strain CJ2) TaxID=365044 RepID=A1VV34_POLNA|nr:type IV secretion system protein [Polaromonas naphthalenivorans]ABM39512.1 hypothetical protein Pnap_4229 [Polaromonas naphthalenivorans CJ2]